MLPSVQFFFKNNYRVFLLLLISAAAYWQIFFLQYSVTWDMLDVNLPWKYFIGESLHNGIFPYWNPYQQLGYPIHADLKSALYPESFIIGSALGYSNYTFHFLVVFYIFLAGFGMYKLSYYLGKNKNTALMAGMAYLLSGYFVQQSQDMVRIIGAAFIPYIILYYLKILEELKYIHVLKASFFLFLMITGGYQALTIILFYLLLIIFIYHLIKTIKRRDFKRLAAIIKLNVFLFFVMLLLCTVVIVVIYQVSPYVQRLGGLSLKDALFCPFSPQCSISFLLPFSVVKDSQYFDTDISMTNAYAGMFFLLFFIAALFRKKSAFEWILIIFGLICLLASFGEYLPVREFLFRYIPMFNLFRFPSYFSLFATIAIIIIAGNQLPLLAENIVKNKKLILICSGIFLAAFLVFFFYSATQISFNEFSFFKAHNNIFEMLRSSALNENIFIHSLIQIVLLIVFIIYILKLKNTALFLNGLFCFILIEMLIAVQLNIFYTGVNEAEPSEIKKYLSGLPKGFPIPDSAPVIKNTDQAASHWPLWRNTNIFVKKVSPDGFNSFQLRAHEVLFDSFPNLKNTALNNALVYLSDKIYPFKQLKDSLNPVTDHKNIYVENTDYGLLKETALKNEPGDTVTIVSFSPIKITAKAKVKNASAITLLQSNYPGWSVYAGDKQISHFTSNKLFISAIIPAGENTITFEYKNTKVFTGFIVSYAVFGIITLILIIYGFKKRYRGER
ncbi:MAG: hypothetical protein HY958_07470 [Bacteroidia bacterium]|nr:hypothetical protein [Bacteroidia bacterium]